MSGKAQYQIPAGLKEAEERFAEWRSSHAGRRPVPEPLWALASELAVQHGVFHRTQVLRLDYTRLKRHTQAVAPAEEQPSAPAAALRNSRKTGRPAPLSTQRSSFPAWRRGKTRPFALLGNG